MLIAKLILGNLDFVYLCGLYHRKMHLKIECMQHVIIFDFAMLIFYFLKENSYIFETFGIIFYIQN